jgi:uncharacterized protein Smg (DUF494 family)
MIISYYKGFNAYLHHICHLWLEQARELYFVCAPQGLEKSNFYLFTIKWLILAMLNCKLLSVYDKMADFLPSAKNANFYLFTIKWLIFCHLQKMQIFICLR